jgi:hypothetical protein
LQATELAENLYKKTALFPAAIVVLDIFSFVSTYLYVKRHNIILSSAALNGQRL